MCARYQTYIYIYIYIDIEFILQNLDALHDHLGTLYPGMRAPSFRCTERPEDGALILHYYSDRPGLEHIVIGIVKVFYFSGKNVIYYYARLEKNQNRETKFNSILEYFLKIHLTL